MMQIAQAIFKIIVLVCSLKKQPSEVLYEKAVLKNFAILLCFSLFLIKLEPWRPATLLKWDLNADVFLWILRNFKEHLFFKRLLLLRVVAMLVLTFVGWEFLKDWNQGY